MLYSQQSIRLVGYRVFGEAVEFVSMFLVVGNPAIDYKVRFMLHVMPKAEKSRLHPDKQTGCFLIGSLALSRLSCSNANCKTR